MISKGNDRLTPSQPWKRAQFYSVSKKRQGLSTKTEVEGQEVAEEIHYVGRSPPLVNWETNPTATHFLSFFLLFFVAHGPSAILRPLGQWTFRPLTPKNIRFHKSIELTLRPSDISIKGLFRLSLFKSSLSLRTNAAWTCSFPSTYRPASLTQLFHCARSSFVLDQTDVASQACPCILARRARLVAWIILNETLLWFIFGLIVVPEVKIHVYLHVQ